MQLDYPSRRPWAGKARYFASPEEQTTDFCQEGNYHSAI
jgi:hypothetical protein